MSCIPIFTMEYIRATDAAKVIGCRRDDFNFTEECDNGSFVDLDLSDWKVEELETDIRWYENKFEDKYCQRLKNDLALVNCLRSRGYRDSIKVLVSW